MSKSMIRILHASPGTPAVDLYVNEELLVQDLSYEEITDYFTFMPGEYNLRVFKTGETTNPALDIDLVIMGEDNLTVAVTGVFPRICVVPVKQTNDCPSPGQALVRFVHLSPDAPIVDITLADGTPLFGDVEYTEVSDYLAVDAGSYDLQVRSQVGTVVLEIPDVQFTACQLYTIYAVGRVEGQPDLKALMVTESNNHCAREAPSAAPVIPDARPYNWKRVQIKLHYR